MGNGLMGCLWRTKSRTSFLAARRGIGEWRTGGGGPDRRRRVIVIGEESEDRRRPGRRRLWWSRGGLEGTNCRQAIKSYHFMVGRGGLCPGKCTQRVVCRQNCKSNRAVNDAFLVKWSLLKCIDMSNVSLGCSYSMGFRHNVPLPHFVF
ncbi:hypothetical protein ACLB2K_046122 [Fragaria x ananassa]